MKKLLLIVVLALMPFAAQAEDRVIQLEGNTKVIAGNGYGRTHLYNNYDTEELIKRRLLGYDDRIYYRDDHHIPTNEYTAICGNADRASERRRCREDVRDLENDRVELYEKYN